MTDKNRRAPEQDGFPEHRIDFLLPEETGRRRNDARNGNDEFQPHNSKKEGLGPNTRR